jgi:hypothetical protein
MFDELNALHKTHILRTWLIYLLKNIQLDISRFTKVRLEHMD